MPCGGAVEAGRVGAMRAQKVSDLFAGEGKGDQGEGDVGGPGERRGEGVGEVELIPEDA